MQPDDNKTDKSAKLGELRSEASLPGHLKGEGEERKVIQAGPIGEGAADAQLTYALSLLKGVDVASRNQSN